VVRKPDYGGMGAAVNVVRKSRLKWKPITTRATGTSSAIIVQQFIYTGDYPISYRVNTLFGKALYSVKFTGSRDRPELSGPSDIQSSIVASHRGSQVTLNDDEEIIRFGEAAHSAFPAIPLLGFDIVRENPTGKLYVLEANAIGYVWNFNSATAARYGFSPEEQFDGMRKAAYILAETTQQYAT
jgi:glutathione synthase/RimK-type ligase-like ATP-grasp enzyme